MAAKRRKKLPLTFHPLTIDRWADFEALFGKNGACGGCWCMVWRLRRSEFESQKGQANKDAMNALVAAGEAPGLLAYLESEPVGWCAIAPRENYPALERSRMLKRLDDTPVWSISCLFVARPYRNQGVSVHLLKAAVAHAAECGGKVVEGLSGRTQGQGDAGSLRVDGHRVSLPPGRLCGTRPKIGDQADHALRCLPAAFTQGPLTVLFPWRRPCAGP